MDAEGGKIETSIRKPMIKKFAKVIVEGEVYAMAYFSVVNNYGSYRATRHEFKLLFNSKTKVLSCESAVIPSFGLLEWILSILPRQRESQIICLVGKASRVIVLELANHKEIIKCALFGDYVDMVNDFLAVGSAQRPVVVLQLGRVKSYKGQVNVHNVMNASRLLWDPQIPKAIEFRNGLAIHGIELDVPIRDGIFIVLASVAVVIKGDTWWYMACKCHGAVAPDGGLYYCPGCDSHVIDVTPCFKLKPEVSDGKDAACFILFDFDCYALLKKSCKELLYIMKDPSFVEHPPECDSLIGRELLFKVEKQADCAYRYEDSFKVKKICVDSTLEKDFISTPESLKMRSTPSSLPAVGEVGVLLEELSKGQTSLSQIEIGTIGLGESSSTSFQSIDRNKERVNTHLESVMLQLSNNESTALRLLELTAIPLGDGVGNVDAEVDDLNEKVEVVSECSNGCRKRIKLKPVKLEQYKC
ncbi:hypothetical protein E2542_SST22806 [Spatholobus suberectus]|nr:hypothetical protein E2542_SST22806 [Spatholobus suberectus]